MNPHDKILLEQNNPHIFTSKTTISTLSKVLISFCTFLLFVFTTFIFRLTYVPGQNNTGTLISEIFLFITGFVTLVFLVMWIMEGQPPQKKTKN